MTFSPSPPSTPPPTTATTAGNQNQKSIPNPRRLLILTPTSHSLTTIPPLLHTLTGVPVDNPPTAEAATTPTITEAETETETETETTPATTTTFAGYTTHPPLHIENKYYTADIPIWVDEIPLSCAPAENTPAETKESTGTTQWKTEFSGPEARVVRDAIGGVMVCIRNPQPPNCGGSGGGGDEDIAEKNDIKSIKDFLQCIGDVKRLVEEERGDIGFGEVLGVIVLVEGSSSGSKSASSADRKRVNDDDDDDLDTGPAEEEPFSIPWWEDQLDEIGLMDFDVVKWDSGVEEDDKRDKYGGASPPFLHLHGYMAMLTKIEYQGMRRIRQILETHDWSEDTDTDANADGNGLEDDDLEEHLLGLDSSRGFNLEVNELEREMVGLRFAIERGGDGSDFEDEDVDEDGDGDDDIKVESMEALMLRMQAIKGMSSFLYSIYRTRC